MSTVILYHAGCYDGFTAAWAAWKAIGNDAEYIPVKYGTEPPWEKCRDARVYIVDFSYPRAMLEKLNKAAQSLAVYDHHVTAQKELEGLPYCTFDMDKSGARLAWEAFHPGVPAPALVAYVEDRDLWRWVLEDSELVNAALGSYDFDFLVWEKMGALDPADFCAALASDGAALKRNNDRAVQRAANDAYFMHIVIDGERCTVPVVNTNLLQSELGNYLAGEKGYGVALLWNLTSTGDVRCSLRSVGALDVSAAARANGGGGHTNAAGFTLPAATFFGAILRGELALS